MNHLPTVHEDPQESYSDVTLSSGDNDDTDSINESTSVTSVQSENNENIIHFATTNARSMSNKAKAIAECFSELDLTVLTVTETWLKDGRAVSYTHLTLPTIYSV